MHVASLDETKPQWCLPRTRDIMYVPTSSWLRNAVRFQKCSNRLIPSPVVAYISAYIINSAWYYIPTPPSLLVSTAYHDPPYENHTITSMHTCMQQQQAAWASFAVIRHMGVSIAREVGENLGFGEVKTTAIAKYALPSSDAVCRRLRRSSYILTVGSRRMPSVVASSERESRIHPVYKYILVQTGQC